MELAEVSAEIPAFVLFSLTIRPIFAPFVPGPCSLSAGFILSPTRQRGRNPSRAEVSARGLAGPADTAPEFDMAAGRQWRREGGGGAAADLHCYARTLSLAYTHAVVYVHEETLFEAHAHSLTLTLTLT